MAGHFLVLFLLIAAGLLSSANLIAADFEKDILPVLKDRCMKCHSGSRGKGGLKLDTKTAAMKGGDSGRAIVPGNSSASLLIERITTKDKAQRMPPQGEPLSPVEIERLEKWINTGADWPVKVAILETNPGDWALKPLAVKTAPNATNPAIHPIDAFIDAKLAGKGLKRSPMADRRTLIRRLCYDLTGLPPTPEEIKGFIEDKDPKAYEKLVERLLASPRYGEHWGRHWLDVVHYADTHGHDHDWYRPNAWPYRDYVIRSFNEDKPYSRFVREQIAGDELYPDDPQATVALGFLAAGPWDHTLFFTVREDTVDHRMGRNLDRDNIVSTVMSTFTSLTVHCARCHDHKFDPISQREYYALQAVFAGIDRADRAYDPDPETIRKRKDLLARRKAILDRTPEAIRQAESPETVSRLAALASRISQDAGKWRLLELSSITSRMTGKETRFDRQEDGSWFVSGSRPDKDIFVITTQTNLRKIRSLQLEVLPDPRLPQGGPGRYDNGNFHLSQFRAVARPAAGDGKDREIKLTFSRAIADHSDGGDTVANALLGQQGKYWSINPLYNAPHEALFELKEPLELPGETRLEIELDFSGKPGHQIGRFRLWVSAEPLPANQTVSRDPTIPARMLAGLRVPIDMQTPQLRRDLGLMLLEKEIGQELDKLPKPQMVYAATREFEASGSFKPFGKPRPIHLLKRGDITRPGELIGPGTVSCLPGLPGILTIANPENEALRRVGMADWLTDSRNVLLWRSIANRVWHYHFGSGISNSPNDFGKMGDMPSHPEMLDFLAVWFRDEARGSLKALHRLIVTSETWKQTSAGMLAEEGQKPVPAKGVAIDADNRLLWRMNRNRLTAEMVRDSVLQMSGRLNLKMGGPSVVQFNNKGIGETFMPTSGAPPYLDYEKFDPDAPENNRRSIYRFLFRTVPDPLMMALDCPDGGAMTPVRGNSSTALQALAMLNNTFLLRQTEHIAARIARNTPKPADQIAAAFQLMLQRSPTPRETELFVGYVQKHGLANACHLLLNSNEFLYLD